MSEAIDPKLKANELRKKGDLEGALPLYKELWEKNRDKFSAAGLIFCYRKQKQFDQALPLAKEAFTKFPNFDWCRNEYIWTLIQGKLYTFPENGSLGDLVNIVNEILDLKPDEIAFKITVFKLLKSAKKHGDWNLLNNWITKIDPTILNGYTDESTGWTDKELWYYYRVNGLIYSHQEEEAINIINDNRNEFHKQNKFFERLKAKANINLEKFDEAEKSYYSLISLKRDWWLLHEYGNVLLKQNKTELALSIFMEAAISPPMKLELKVSLFADIGNLLLQVNKKDDALYHFILSKAVREKQGWGIGELSAKITELDPEGKIKQEIRVILPKCKAIWQRHITTKSGGDLTKSQQSLKGNITNFNNDRPFCFIRTSDNQSYFCSKDDLPKGAVEGQEVQFDLKPSFDKKKNEKGFKATNVK